MPPLYHLTIEENAITPAERKSFAVCVAEILEQRKLLTPSDCFTGIYGWMLAFSVGWSQQLNFKLFEVQLAEIAKKAVDTWQAEAEPTIRWPYVSPTTKDKVKAWCCCARPSRTGMFALAQDLERPEQELLLSDFKHSTTTTAPLVTREKNDIALSITTSSSSSSSRFFDRSATAEERLGLIEKQVQNIAGNVQEISGNIKTINSRVEQLEAETRPLLRSSSSSS